MAALCLLFISLSSCHEVRDDRIPQMPVNIALTDVGLWNTYGVTGYGLYRCFSLQASPTEPAGFPWLADSRTGFAGVLLIGGMDPYSGQTNAPLAYDLACPVERRQDVRVYVSDDTFEAICPVCGSHYDVCMAGGAPVSGPAAAKNHRYALKRYKCIGSPEGGYLITY